MNKTKIRALWRRVHGKSPEPPSVKSLCFLPRRLRPPSSVVGLSVETYGRMGNNLLQSANAILLARALELPFVKLPKSEILQLTGSRETSGLTLLANEFNTARIGGFLSGHFYSGAQVQRIGATMEHRRRAIQTHLLPHLDLPLAQAEPEGCLTIHLRSGDIFRPNPHKAYAQPPLAFYARAIEDARKAWKIDRVRLVFEDRTNPCVAPLETYIQESGLALLSQSGTFQEDVATLLKARHLVFGFGTFGVGICLLSNAALSVDVFGVTGFSFAELKSLKRVQVFGDTSGMYPRVGEWTASPEQRKLMTSLPSEAIGHLQRSEIKSADPDGHWFFLNDEL